MKHKYNLLLSMVLLTSLCSFIEPSNTNQDKRKVSNKLYSITFPSSWKLSQGIKGDGIAPDERNGGPYHLYYLGWSETTGVFENRMSISIQSYKRLDGKPLSVGEIEESNMASHKAPLAKNAKKTILSAKPNQRRYMIAKEGGILNGSFHKCRIFNIIQKSNQGIVHHVNLYIGEDYYQKAGVPKLINEILNSFTVREK